MKKVFACFTFCLIFLLAGCGSSSKPTTTTTTKQNPLDPQGNWMFTITGTDVTLLFGGELFELNPPVVTSNDMPRINNDQLVGCNGAIHANGQASGTNTINLTLNQINAPAPLATFALTGTIADDQAHMSGTWTSTAPGNCQLDTSGTWSALLIPSVTGSWSGTLSGTAVALSLTEDTSQTSTSMGQVTGTVTVTSPCFAGPLDIPAYSAGGNSNHVAQRVFIDTSTDSNGASAELNGAVDSTAPTIFTGSLGVKGGACNGQIFSGTLTKQ